MNAEVVENTGVEGEPPETPDAPQADTRESEARKHGWRTKEEFVARGGKEEDWTPAAQYLQIKEQLGDVRKREAKRLERQLSLRDQKIEELERTVREFNERLSTQDKVKGEVQEQVLWGQRRQALEVQNWDLVNDIDKQLLSLKSAPAKDVKPAKDEAGNKLDPRVKAMFDDFAEDHPEYERPEMQKLLLRSMVTLAQVDPDLKGRELLEEAHDHAKRTYSDRYTTKNPARKQAPMAETDTRQTRGASDADRSWDDLRPEVRTALDDFIKSSPTHAKMKLADARKSILRHAPAEHFRGSR